MAIANSIGVWENTLVDSFKTLATQNNIEILSPVSFQMDVQDFKTQITRLKADKPDAIFIPMTSGPVERFVKQAGELDLNTPLMYPVDVFSVGIPEKVPASSLKNLVYASYASSTQKFADAFKNEYGTEPGVSADTAYDAVYMLANAIKNIGGTDPENVRSSFTSFDGASGKIIFDQDRDRSGAEVILRIFDGLSNKPVKIN